MKLSIVTTLYQSSAYINEFYQRASASAKELVGDNYEIILVNDGSPDDSLDKAIKLTESDNNVVVVDLSRNFGHHKAMMTGLAQAKGDRIFLLDIDLEEEPEWLQDFHKKMENELHCDVVYGQQNQRKGNWFERFSGEWFYRLFQTITGLALPKNIITARLMTRDYVNALLLHREREVFLAGLWHITGFNQQAHIVKKHDTSETTYTFRKKISLLVNSVTSFSSTPLIFIFYSGLIVFSIALIYTGFLIINKIFLSEPLSGWTSVMASVWLLGGMILSSIGIIGIYLSKIFSETKQRPYTIVKKVYEKRQ